MPNNNKITLLLSLTNICNYSCIFCRGYKAKSKKFLDLSVLKNLESIFPRVSSLDITGTGEVTTHPQFFEILEYLAGHKIPLRMVTNGSRLTKEVVDRISQSTVEQLVISLNSLNKETYGLLSGGVGDLGLVLGNIDYLVGKCPNVKIVFSFVMTSRNFSETLEFVGLGAKYKKEIALIDLTPTIKDYESDLVIIDNKENRKQLEEVRTAARARGVSAFVFRFDKRKAQVMDSRALVEIVKRCYWPTTMSSIGINGEVGVCCWSPFSPGNINSESFEAIWDGPKYNELRECIRNGDTKYCKNCRREG